MRSLYLDNAATAFPKAPGVAKSMANYLTNVGCNVNRGAYQSSFEAENIVFETRELVCELFNYEKAENVVFTKNITESLNVLIKGLLKDGDHVIVSSMEHNAVMRPINALKRRNVSYSTVPCNKVGELNAEDIKKYIKTNTKAVIMTQASNVCGTILELEKAGEICKDNDLFFIIDTAQSAGFLNINFKKLNADAIAFTGHKGLLGPQGMGGFVAGDKIIENMNTFIEGGTGSLSEHEIQPDYMPDKFEGGTLNIPGIYGLNTSLKYLLKRTIDVIREEELIIVERFLNKAMNISGLELIGKKTIEGRTGAVSVIFPGEDNGQIAHKLNKNYGIMTRSGLHCAPSAHKTLGTFPNGTVRFGFSHFNKIEDVDYAIDSINKALKDIE